MPNDLNYYPSPVSRNTSATVQTRSIDWDVLVLRVAGPPPAKEPVYFFGNGAIKYEYADHNPFV